MGQCYNTTGGNSQIFLSCDASGIPELWYTGLGCQGQGSPSHMDVGTCLVSETNSSFINTCVDAGSTAVIHGAPSSTIAREKNPVTSEPALNFAASAVRQLSCTDEHCSSDCTNSQWNINQCYNTTGGNSQIFLSCDASGIPELWYTGLGCQGQGSSSHMDVGTCLVSETSSSFINTCVDADGTTVIHGALSSTIPRIRNLFV